jgi:hypothetical protein
VEDEGQRMNLAVQGAKDIISLHLYKNDEKRGLQDQAEK